VEIRGDILRQALEHAFSRIAEDKEEGRFLQVSGLQMTYDSRRPSGSRLVSAMINGQLLNEKKNYTLATNSYLTSGGDGYAMLTGLRYLVDPVQGPVVPAVIMGAIAGAGEIAPQVEGRIRSVKVGSNQ
jgi:5'-nucleotidase